VRSWQTTVKLACVFCLAVAAASAKERDDDRRHDTPLGSKRSHVGPSHVTPPHSTPAWSFLRHHRPPAQVLPGSHTKRPVGAPGPVAGAGLPALMLAGAYAIIRHRRGRQE
jgi:hypothetical protein